MPRINTYNLDETIRPDDLLIGSSLEGTFNGQPIYNTKNYRLSKLAEFFIGYDFNAGLSLTTIEGIVDGLVVDVSGLQGDVSTLQTNLTTLTGRVNTAETRITNNYNATLSLQNQLNVLYLSTPNWNAAYNESITGITVTASPDGSQKTITLTRRNAIDLSDGFADVFESGAGGITDTNNYVDTVSFSSGTLTLGRLGLTDLTASIDGRYSLLGHTHTTTDITNLSSYTGFDSRYVNTTGDVINGFLTIGGTSVGVSEGGQLNLNLPTSSTLSGSLAIDSYNNRLRIFETGGSNRGVYIDLTEAGNGTSSSVWHSGNLTPSDYLPLSGGTINGNLTVSGNDIGIEGSSPRLQLTETGLSDWYLVADNQSLSIRQTDLNTQRFSISSSGVLHAGAPASNNIIWHAGNDGPGSGLDADSVDGYTWGNVGVPLTLKNFTSTANSERLQIEPTDYGVGKPRFLIKKDLIADKWTLGLWDGVNTNGTLAIAAGLTQVNNQFSVVGTSQMNGQLTVSDEIDCGSVVFTAISGVANANNVKTFMPQANSIGIYSHSTGSTNWQSEFGVDLVVRGNTDGRIWALERANNGTVLNFGYFDGTTWAWNEIFTEKGSLPSETSMKSSTLKSGIYRVNTLTTSSVGDGVQVLDAPDDAEAFGTMVNYDNSGDTFYRIYKNYQDPRMWVFSGNTSGSSQNGWYEMWNSGNDGSGSGLDADLLDGIDSSQFLRSDEDDTMLGFLTFASAKGVKGSLYDNTGQVILNNPVNSTEDRWFKGNLLGTINDPLSASVDTVVYNPGTGTLYKNMLMSDGVKIIFKAGTPQEEVLDEVALSNFGYAYDNVIIDASFTDNILTLTKSAATNLTVDLSSIDADLLDGIDSTQFLRSDIDDTMSGFLSFDAAKGVKGSLYNNSNQVILNNPASSSGLRWFKGDLLGNVNDYGSASVDSVVFNPSTGTMFKDLIMGVVASTPKNIYIGGYGSGQVVGGGLYIYDNINGTPGYRAVTGERISTWDSLSDGQITSATLNSSEELVLSRAITPLTVSFARYGRKDQNESWGTNTITAGDFILNSDERIKENIGDYVPKRIELNYKEYNLKDDLHKNKRIGVIAQELEVDNPEFVRENEDGVKSVSYIDLLMAKVAELEERIKQLENGNTR